MIYLGNQSSSAIPSWPVCVFASRGVLDVRVRRYQGWPESFGEGQRVHLGIGFAGCMVVINLRAVKTTAVAWCPLQRGNPVPFSQ